MQDLEIIKKKYGEKMSHFCRDLFPIILEQPSVLSTIITEKFAEERSLYDDIIKFNLEDDFKKYIFSTFDNLYRPEEKKEDIMLTPSELLNEAGYILYKCETEEDIQKFKKYYAPGEELCTFNGGRLKRCYVYFAVKKDIDNIKRENFKNPERQDEYGTSIISIQFTKDEHQTISIKNRYNHTVSNPDATFSNNLDNIIPGLKGSFAKYEGRKSKKEQEKFFLENYVMANDGKFYKYNKEINNVYYCPNNIIIDNFEVKKYPKEQYVIFDYFILDLKQKKIELYDKSIKDSFPSSINLIKKVEIFNDKEKSTKKIILTPSEGEDIVLEIDKYNNLIALTNSNMKRVGDKFLYFNLSLLELNTPNLEEVGDKFLCFNLSLLELNTPNLEEVGDNFLDSNLSLLELNLPSLKRIGNNFISYNKLLKGINIPNLEEVGDYFLRSNLSLLELNLPKLKRVGNTFISNNKLLKGINLPSLKRIGNYFLYSNFSLLELNLPKLKHVGNNFISHNQLLKGINIPNLEEVGDNFLDSNLSLLELNIPNLEEVGDYFLFSNLSLLELEVPKLKRVGNNFISYNELLKGINIPNLEEVGDNFLYFNLSLLKLDLPSLKRIGNYFLYFNEQLQELSMPNLEEVGEYSLFYNNSLQKLIMPKAKHIGSYSFYTNSSLQVIVAPALESVGEQVFYSIKSPQIIDMLNIKVAKQENIIVEDSIDSMKR